MIRRSALTLLLAAVWVGSTERGRLAGGGPKRGQGEWTRSDSAPHKLTSRSAQGLYWIFAKPEHEADYPVPDEEKLNLGGDELGPRHPDPNFRPLGHISLDWCDYMGDEILASRYA